LGKNKLTCLPESIGNLTNLKKLSLIENNLTSLPESIDNLTNLQTFRHDFEEDNVCRGKKLLHILLGHIEECELPSQKYLDICNVISNLHETICNI